jgi:hypothetical protein
VIKKKWTRFRRRPGKKAKGNSRMLTKLLGACDDDRRASPDPHPTHHLRPREHFTDTHGFSEQLFGLCYLLGFGFMPRLRDLADQQLYRLDPHRSGGAPVTSADRSRSLLAGVAAASVRKITLAYCAQYSAHGSVGIHVGPAYVIRGSAAVGSCRIHVELPILAFTAVCCGKSLTCNPARRKALRAAVFHATNRGSNAGITLRATQHSQANSVEPSRERL